jgi:hypothetical protein
MEKKIKSIVNKYDPINLLCFGHSNEYSLEINQIVNYLKLNPSPNEQYLAEFIEQVFKKSFQEGVTLDGTTKTDNSISIGSVKVYKMIAEEIAKISL